MRPIDADALIHHFYETEYASMYYVEVVKRIIDAQPTLSPDEVRGVVHCGECKFWRRPPSCEGLARCETGETGIRYRSKNDFCSRGARMKGTDDGTTDMER